MIGKSYEAFTDELESLAAAAHEAEVEMPGLGPHIAALEDQLGEVRNAKARQQMHTAKRQEATQELYEELTTANDLAIQLRSVVRAELGPRDPRLARFGVPSLKKPRPRKPAPETGPPPVPAATATVKSTKSK